MKYQYQINGKTIFFYCDEGLKNVVEFFVSILESEDKLYNILKSNHVIQIGWNYYRIVGEKEPFQIVALDYKSNPFKKTTDDLSVSLSIFNEQAIILKKARLSPQDISFQDTMIVQKNAIDASKIYLQRSRPVDKNDSGWYMGSMDEKGSQDLEDYIKIYTYQLNSFCKVALSIIQLPVGVIALIEDGKLVEVVDENNYKVI